MLREAGVKEGDLLFGKYRVERVIGSGGMGIVVAARHEQLDQLVAIKFISGEALDRTDASLRFVREARAAAKLKGEHVTRVLDVGVLESGAPYMIMEYLEGSDLSKVLAEYGPMPPAYALRLFRQACAALSEAHAAGIVHRDLKPQNLFLTHTPNGSPRVKVLDFGISKNTGVEDKAAHALTSATAILGSPLYMAPEQMQSSRDVDARADVWSLGVVLFELLTGSCPFDADTYAGLCVKIANGVRPRLADLRPDVPREVVAIVDRCLEQDASKRFANAAAVAVALDALDTDILPRSEVQANRSDTLLSAAGKSPSGSVRKAESTPAGWSSRGDGKAKNQSRRTLAAGALLLTGVALAAGFLISRRWSAKQDSAPPASSAIVEVVAPVAAASPPPEPTAAPSDIPVPVPSSEVAAQPSSAAIPTDVPTTPPARRHVAPAVTAPLATSSVVVDSDGIPVRRAPSTHRTAPAATPSTNDANAASVDGIPSRR